MQAAGETALHASLGLIEVALESQGASPSPPGATLVRPGSPLPSRLLAQAAAVLPGECLVPTARRFVTSAVRACALAIVLAVVFALASPAAAASAPRAVGLYVLDDAANLAPVSKMYPVGLFTDTTYARHVAGHAIFCPLAKILPSVPVWGALHFDWSVLDSLTQLATTHGKSFSIELETGFQTSAQTYKQALPDSFSITCGGDCAPLFDVWATGGSGGICTSSYVLLPWVPKVRQFWSLVADSLAAHLRDTGAYPSLTLVHVPGLSVYDEELRLPTGQPSPSPSDTGPCPDSLPAYPTVIDEATTTKWLALGYSDSAVIAGFDSIATSFARAFPDRMLGLSLFPHGAGAGIAFPNVSGDSAGYVSARLVEEVARLAPGRLLIQSDNLDSATVVPSVISLARENEAAIGWQTNKHGGTGAGCGGGGAGSCLPDTSDGHYYQMLAYGAAEGAHYVEIWPRDVLAYPQDIAGVGAAGLYSLVDVPPWGDRESAGVRLVGNAPNPFRDHTTILYELARPDRVRLGVYDVAGRRRGLLVDAPQSAGRHAVRYDALGLASGVYFVRIEAAGVRVARAIIVLR